MRVQMENTDPFYCPCCDNEASYVKFHSHGVSAWCEYCKHGLWAIITNTDIRIKKGK